MMKRLKLWYYKRVLSYNGYCSKHLTKKTVDNDDYFDTLYCAKCCLEETLERIDRINRIIGWVSANQQS